MMLPPVTSSISHTSLETQRPLESSTVPQPAWSSRFRKDHVDLNIHLEMSSQMDGQSSSGKQHLIAHGKTPGMFFP
jgi:hypothetical protein